MAVERARALAKDAHAGQHDRDGSLHIDHVARVAAGVPANAAYQRVAWLHDVLEDSDVVADDLRGQFPGAEVDAVVLLTHDDGAEEYAVYVQRIVAAPGAVGHLARVVKEADMLDNLRRCARDRDRAVAQYADALALLWAARPSEPPSPVSVNAAPVSIKGVCLDSCGRVLLGRSHRGEWELPGGRPDAGERFADCLVREITEETGLQVAVSNLISAEPFDVIPGRWVNVIIYGCELLGGDQLVVSDEHDRVAFLAASTLSSEDLPDVYRHAIVHQLERCS